MARSGSAGGWEKWDGGCRRAAVGTAALHRRAPAAHCAGGHRLEHALDLGAAPAPAAAHALPVLPRLVAAARVVDPDTLEPDLEQQVAFYTSPPICSRCSAAGWPTRSRSCSPTSTSRRSDRGVPAPFHWAWSFLSPYAYAIGRGVVMNRRTGKGIVIVWVAVGLIVLGLVIGFGIAVMVMSTVFSQLSELSGAVRLPRS